MWGGFWGGVMHPMTYQELCKYLSLNSNRKDKLTWEHLFAGTRDFVACNHLRSYKYYSDSIIYPDGFLGYPCASYEVFDTVSTSQSLRMDHIRHSGSYLYIWNTICLCHLALNEQICKRHSCQTQKYYSSGSRHETRQEKATTKQTSLCWCDSPEVLLELVWLSHTSFAASNWGRGKEESRFLYPPSVFTKQQWVEAHTVAGELSNTA